MSACVTLEEVLDAAHARHASLAPETSGYLALAVSDATSRLPLRLEDRAVLLTTEGTVTVRSRGEPVAPAEAARLLRDLLARLLAASAGSVPNLAATARPRPEPDRDPVAVARELEAALIPVNRNAARRALARLARETLRAKDAGRLRRARGEGRPSAAAAERPAPPPRDPALPGRAAEDTTCVDAAVAPLAGAAAAPLADAAVAPLVNVAATPAVLELTLSPGPVAPAVLELTLDPGPVAGEATAGPTLPAPALSSAPVEPMAVDAAPPSAQAAKNIEQAEAFPEPTPTVVQAAVVEIEAASAPAELPAIPELIEPPRLMAPVAPIAAAAPGGATTAAAAAPAPAGERAFPGPEAITCDAAASSEAFTSPEGIEAILVELSPDPTGVVPLSQEPTPTVATAVWAEMAEDEGAAGTSVAGAPACVAEVQANAVETSRAPAVALLLEQEPALLEQEPAPQLTPAYGAWPLADRKELAAMSAGRRASVAPLDETPAARHTLPWPVPSRHGDVAPWATAPANPAAPSGRAEASPASGHEPPAAAPSTEAAPAPTPCPPGLAPVDAILWSASRSARSALSADGAGVSRVDELVARFVARSERSAQRRAARSMKVLAGLDPTLTPPPVAPLSTLAARQAPAVLSLSADAPLAPRPVPSEGAAPASPLDETSRPPAPLVAPRRRGLSLWIALVALALLCAGLAGTLRPELFASLAHPLAQGALDAAPRADAQPLPAHD
ncbi:uncharacterized protein SOCE26_071930 [Sorangium cellulosum]|uniref:Uncharacterized protein n=1 Tax=Sorangium cellulosum TaxID=56 RepID=A0A2L0F2C5_SORCE|nr:hypothetical protein [Sorangium cellulosum]AUX45697.1 uncharacterized protein SOCE26_071930 [Sorangium cellulosum]